MPLCAHDQLECVRNITINEMQCGEKCSGLLVPSYYKANVENKDWLQSFHLKKEFKFGIVDSLLVIPSCIPSLWAGIILLYGALKYNADATLLYLMIRAILATLSIAMGIKLFVLFSNGSKSFSGEHQEMEMNLMIGMELVMILHALLDVYFWICVFNLYSKVKSRTDSSNV